MIVFDHVDRGGYADDPLMDGEQPFLPNPLRLVDVKAQLAGTGWREPEIRELDAEYAAWYAGLVGRIERAREGIVDLAGPRGYDHVVGLYRGLADAARRGRLGAALLTTAPASRSA